MAEIKWRDILGWGQAEIVDLRHAAYAYIKQGVYDVALTFFDALRILDPSSPYDLQTLGALHLQMGNGLEALDYLEQALKLEPTHLPTQLNRAKALFMLGYKKQGLSLAQELEKSELPAIASQAAALILAYQ